MSVLCRSMQAQSLLPFIRRRITGPQFLIGIRSTAHSAGLVKVLFSDSAEIHISLESEGRQFQLAEGEDINIGHTLGVIRRWKFGSKVERYGLNWYTRRKVSLRSPSGTAVEVAVTNRDAWCNSKYLNVGVETFAVQLERPSPSVKLPRLAVESFEIVPVVSCGVGSKENAQLQYRWYRCERQRSVLVGTNKCYVPSRADVGCKLYFVVLPSKDSTFRCPPRAMKIGKVLAKPSQLAFETRLGYCRPLYDVNSPCIRVVSYDIHSQRRIKQNSLTDHRDYRLPLLTREILSYNADLICLQDVEKSAFHNQLSPNFTPAGYGGSLAVEKGETEGCALFYRQERFGLLDARLVKLSSYLQQDRELEWLAQRLNHHPEVQKHVLSSPTIVQLSLLQNKFTDQVCVVANTKLDPGQEAHNTRFVQAVLITRSIAKVLDSYSDLPVLLCGNLCSLPESAVFQYLLCGKNQTDHKGNQEQPLITTHSLRLTTSSSRSHSNPPYTLLLPEGAFLHDYVFFSEEKFLADSILPEPRQKVLAENGHLPSPSYPSSHLAVVVDLQQYR